ncbi:MAG TPA: hypothetical protein VJ877_06735, partial [Bacteroidales bacterium]|nr:hypothetical protein [Bacteroidales bacterium]
MNININSEIGILDGVIIHTPGTEVENMTPKNAERALYSDILNLAVAGSEYSQFKGVLNKITQTFEVKTLLTGSLEKPGARKNLIGKVAAGNPVMAEKLHSLPGPELASALIEGVPIERNNLTKFLSKER